jgi:hypothetical protein
MRADSEELEGEGRVTKKVLKCEDCEHYMPPPFKFCMRSKLWLCERERGMTGKEYCGLSGKFFKLKVDA